MNTTTPQVSGLSAYFTNEGAEGLQTFTTVSDPDKTFDFEAKTTNAYYKFVGWEFDNGVKITTDNIGSTERSGSYTLVAKFMKVEGGQLILSHSVDTGTTVNLNGSDIVCNGAGNATIAVTVKDGDEILRTYSETSSDIVLDDKYISSDKDYTIEVTLKAQATGEDQLGTTILANPSGQDNTFFNYGTVSTDTATKTNTYTFSFSVEDLFNGTTQNYNSLIYHSYFGQTKFNYKFKFEFTDRFGNAKNYYREGTLTSNEVKNYVIVTESQGTEMHNRYLNPEFIRKLAPYESNFNENFTWNIGAYTDYKFSGPDSYVYTISSTAVSSHKVSSDTRTATFNLPYAHDAYGNATVETPAETTTPNFDVTVPYNTVIKSGTNNETYITAPKQLSNGKYFQYWSLASSSDENTEVARCYFNDFNFVAFDNYVIKPVYDNTEYDYHNSGAFTGITYLDTSRNQWNTDGENHANTDRTNAADLLYNDFVLNYNYNGLDIYKNGTDVSAVTDLGYIIQRVQQLAPNQDGTLDTTLSRYAGTGMDADAAKNVVSNYNTNKGTQNGITKYSGSDSAISRYSISKVTLDNKNRLEIYEGIYNGAGWSKDAQDFVTHYAYKNYVYKVYTYMVVDGVTYVSDVPAYFTMYDVATADYNAN